MYSKTNQTTAYKNPLSSLKTTDSLRFLKEPKLMVTWFWFFYPNNGIGDSSILKY